MHYWVSNEKSAIKRLCSWLSRESTSFPPLCPGFDPLASACGMAMVANAYRMMFSRTHPPKLQTRHFFWRWHLQTVHRCKRYILRRSHCQHVYARIQWAKITITNTTTTKPTWKYIMTRFCKMRWKSLLKGSDMTQISVGGCRRVCRGGKLSFFRLSFSTDPLESTLKPFRLCITRFTEGPSEVSQMKHTSQLARVSHTFLHAHCASFYLE